jgi:hypothetical protein
MKINTYKHSFGYCQNTGLRAVYSANGELNFYEPASENETMSVEYDNGKISIGPNTTIQIIGNNKDAAFGLALLMADNLDLLNYGNQLITRAFEFDKMNGIIKSILETNDQINKFIVAFNKIWPSVLVLRG